MQVFGLKKMIDCHCHISFMADVQLDHYIKTSPRDKMWILGGYDPADWDRQRAIKEKYRASVMTAYGLHPWYVSSSNFDAAKALAVFKSSFKEAQWVGEVGLDYSQNRTEFKELQREVFARQVALTQNQKPLVIHSVQAHADTLEILSGTGTRGFVHGFSGASEVAQSFFSQGFLLSFGPGVLKTHYKKARRALERLPLQAILVESDLSPRPGDASSCKDLFDEVVKEVAEIKKIDIKSLMQITQGNVERLMRG